MLSAEKIWNRRHILRLTLADGRSVVLKRGRDANSARPATGFAVEVAALSFLNGMDMPIAPRLLGADADILIMEDLGPASSLAHSLLAGDPARARADLVAYGRCLGAMHAWSLGRKRSFASLAGPGDAPEPRWIAATANGKKPFIKTATRLRLPGSLAGVAARAQALDQSLEEDRTWGTTTIRPRVLGWLRSFADSAERSGALPCLGALAQAMHARLAERWPDAAMPDYPALARPGYRWCARPTAGDRRIKRPLRLHQDRGCAWAQASCVWGRPSVWSRGQTAVSA